MAFEGNDTNQGDASEFLSAVPLPTGPNPNDSTAKDLDAAHATSAAADALMKSSTPAPAPQVGTNVNPNRPADTGFEVPPAIRPGSMADKMHAAVSKAFLNPASQKPGGGTAALFAGVMGALSGGTPWDSVSKDTDATKPTQGVQPPKPQIGQPIFSALADAAGGGGVMGFAARNAARTRQENEDRRVLATSNAQMIHEQALTHKMGEEAIDNSIKTSTAAMNNAITPVPGAPPEAAGQLNFSDKTSDELKALLASHQFNPSEQTAFATGRRMVGQDANGQPMYRTTYSVITPAKNLDITPENAAYMNKWLGTKWSTDKEALQRMSGAQYLGMMQKAQTAQATQLAVEQNLKENQIKVAHTNAQATALDISSAPGYKDIANAVNAHLTATEGGKTNPYASVQAYNELKNRGFFNDPANGISDEAARLYFGGGDEKNFSTMVDNYAKAQLKAQENVDKSLTPEFAAEHPAGAVAAANSKLTQLSTQLQQQQALINSNNPAISPEQKTDAQNKIADIRTQTDRVQHILDIAKGTITEEEDKKKREAENAEAAKGIDLEKLGDSELMNKILNFEVDPEKMAGIRGNQREKFMEKVAQEAKRRGVDWSEAEYKQRYQTVEDFRPGGQYGKQIIALNTFGKHAGMAEDHIDSLYNTNFKLWNKGLNAIKENLGADQYAKMRADLGVSKKEYLNFLNAGHAETEEDRKFANQLTDENSSPRVIKGVLEEMAATVQARAESMNQQYKETLKRGDFPHMFDTRTAGYLRRFGLDLTDAGGVAGETPKQQAVPQQFTGKIGVEAGGKTHYFNTQTEADNFKKLAGIQ